MIYVINRTDRLDRRQHIMAQLEAQGLNAHLFPAVINRVGWQGCRDSHLACLVHALADEEITTILEDDCLFLRSIQDVQRAMFELPPNWDVLYWGCSPKRPQERYSDRLYKINGALCTHAMMWNPKGDAIEYCLKADDEHRIGKIDVFLMNEVQPQFNCFAAYPMICTQAEGFKSDIAIRSDVSTIERNFNLYCP